MYSYLQGSSRSLNMLVREVLSDRKQEEIPIVRALVLLWDFLSFEKIAYVPAK